MEGKNYLLLIAIDNYKNLSQLNNCVKETSAFKDVLYERFHFGKDETIELFNENATGKKIHDTLSDYINKLNRNDNLIIYFSGHGGYDDKSDRGYWSSYNTIAGDFTTQISNADLLDLLKRINIKHILLISDSCFSRTIFYDGKPKNIQTLYNIPSRCAIASGIGKVYESGNNELNLFTKTIIDCLKNTKKDILASTIIQKLKEKFDINDLQTPQGGPLKLPEHQGGEFIFKLNKESLIDEREFKEFKNFKNILSLYKSNSEFIEIKTHTDKKQRIGFSLYKEEDDTTKQVFYYLYLYQGINQKLTFEYIKTKYSYIFKKEINVNPDEPKKKIQTLIILLPKEKNQKNIVTRKSNVAKRFNPTNLFYIDDFIREKCTPASFKDERRKKYLEISNFVVPSIKEINGSISSIQEIEDWFVSNNNPILALTGNGGIGKTTLVKYIAELYIKKHQKANIIYIDSRTVLENLSKKENDKINLYDFYEADNVSQNKILTEDLFLITVDVGNVLVVIDGLDEVITGVTNFELRKFLDSIKDYTGDFGSGKVIITCRSHFWDLWVSNLPYIKSLEILPFDKLKTNEFFKKYFNNNDRILKKCLKLANEFSFEDTKDNENYHHPYILDVIKRMVESELIYTIPNEKINSLKGKLSKQVFTKIQEISSILFENKKSFLLKLKNILYEWEYLKYVDIILKYSQTTNSIVETDFSFKSEFLEKKSKKDYILFRICKRETSRMNQIEVDDQLKFLIYLAINRKGSIKSENYKDEIINSLEKTIDNKNIKAFKAHPFILKSGQNYIFRYDFLSDYFKSIELSKFVKYDSEDKYSNIPDNIIEILSENCRFNSDIIIDIKERMQKYTDYDLLKISDLISQIKKRENIKEIDKKRAIASLFFIVLSLDNYNIRRNTELLKYFFEEKNEIKNLYLINLFSNGQKVRFNFSDMIIRNSYIDYYDIFWQCKFNNNTFFYDSYLLNLGDNNAHISIPKSNFINCETDSKFNEIFKAEDAEKKSIEENILDFLIHFFRLFYTKGRIERQPFERIVKRRFSYIKPALFIFKDFIDVFEKSGYLEIYEDKEHQEIKAKITKSFSSDVTDFLVNNNRTVKILDIVKKLSTLIK